MTPAHIGFPINGKTVELKLDLDSTGHRWIYDFLAAGRLYEPETVWALASILKPGDTFVDVGAHVGYFSLIAAALVGPMGRVIAFEPNESNFEYLVQNAALNKCRIMTHCEAVGNRKGSAEMWVNLDNDGGHAFWDVGEHPFNVKSKETPTKKLTRLIALDDIADLRPNLIKVDVEGCEFNVMQGATQTLRANPDCAVICEINRYALGMMGATEAGLRTLMEKGHGYQCWFLEQFKCLEDFSKQTPKPLEFGMTANTANVFNVMFKK